MSEFLEKNFKQSGPLNNFIELAKTNDDKSWGEIDEKLSQHRSDPALLDWARENTNNEDSGLRDLAATIYEATETDLSADDVSNLLILMRKADTENTYPSFRAACALAKRKENELIKNSAEEIKNKLALFLDDTNVSEIAQKYLRLIK